MTGHSGSSPKTDTLRSAVARAAPRAFTDSVGVRWTVSEIHPQLELGSGGLFFPHPERRRGWLLFESDEGERHRLAPFPGDWRVVSDFEIERWCMRAARAADLPSRRRDD